MTRLDLDCPVPWRQSTGFTPARPSLPLQGQPATEHDGSPTGKTRNSAQLTLQSPAMLTSTAGDEDETGAASRSTSNEKKGRLPSEQASCTHSEWLERRYQDTLWLGELHSPLSSFLDSVLHIECLLCSPHQTMQRLSQLLKSRDDIRLRFNSSDGFASRQRLIGILKGHDEVLHSAEDASIRSALSSGPAALIGLSLLRRDSTSSNAIGGLARLWLEAIEARELQLQALVILTLLRLSVEHPECAQDRGANQEHSASTKATSSNTADANERGDDEGTVTQTAITKRKRKAEKAQRLTGRGSIFPWQMSRPRESKSKDIDLRAKSVKDLAYDAEALSKCFEGLIDALCMRIATNNGTFGLAEAAEGGVEGLDLSPQGEKTQIGRRSIVPPFGSQGRQRLDRGDDRDVLQWLCCSIIEPRFSTTLLRQCSFIRSRCFVPNATLSTATPAKVSEKRRRVSREKSDKARAVKSGTREDGRPLPRARSTGDVMKLKQAVENNDDATAEATGLRRSLLDEGQCNVKRLQETQAARRQSTWDAREVSVRRRWDRSQSAGPGACLLGTAVDVTKRGQGAPSSVIGPHRSARSLTARPLVRAQSEAGKIFDKLVDESASRAPAAQRQPLSESQVLALETPAKLAKYGSASYNGIQNSWQPSSHFADSRDAFDIGACSGDDDDDHDDDDETRYSPVIRSSGGLSNGLHSAKSRPSHLHSSLLQASPSRQRPFERSASLSATMLSSWQRHP